MYLLYIFYFPRGPQRPFICLEECAFLVVSAEIIGFGDCLLKKKRQRQGVQGLKKFLAPVGQPQSSPCPIWEEGGKRWEPSGSPPTHPRPQEEEM